MLLTQSLFAQTLIKGTVVEKDSVTTMPFVYIINKSNGNGTMSDNDGHFSLYSGLNDTLICSYVGYSKLLMPVKLLKPGADGRVLVVMRSNPFLLSTVNVTTFKIKPYEREYMNDIIDKSKIRLLDYSQSPFTALYMRYSKEGKQITKLAKIFEQILREEQVQKKLSREILVRLTGDEKIDYEAFRRYCYYVNDYYIMDHDGVELYSKVMDCYRRWKEELRQK
jgi:hypothetical protein